MDPDSLISDARSLHPKGQEAIRKRAVVRVLEDGVGKTAVARELGVTRQAVHNWVKRAQKGKSLDAQRRGPKPGSRSLTARQGAAVRKIVVGKLPDQLQLPGLLWTRKLVRELIKRKFDVELSIETVGRYLREWGMTQQKPARRSYKQDPAAVDRWLNVELPALRERARREGAEIHFCDEVGVRSDHQTGTTWGEKGTTPTVPTSGGTRYRVNLIKSVSNTGQMRFMIYEGRFTQHTFIEFMRRLIGSIDRKIYLVVDCLSAHKTRAVREWVAEHAEQIELVFSPTYSPDLIQPSCQTTT